MFRLGKVDRKALGIGCFFLFGLLWVTFATWLSEGSVDWKLVSTVGLILLSLWMGYAWGLDEGYKEGYKDGSEEGYQIGYERGWRDGRGVVKEEVAE